MERRKKGGSVMDFYKMLGLRIKALRQRKRITQEELSGLIGISRTALSSIERGERKIATEEAYRLSDALRIPFDTLIDPDKEIEVILEEGKQSVPVERGIRINIPQKNWAKFREVLLYILGKVGSKLNIGQTVIYKLLYFIDFDFYEMYEEQLIGASYTKSKFGPTPVEFDKVVDRMIKDGDIEKVETEYHGSKQTRYIALRKPDLSVLRGHELEAINDVLDKLSKMNAVQISEYSHRDIPWLTTEDGELIEYESVFYRTPLYSVREYDEEIQEDIAPS